MESKIYIIMGVSGCGKTTIGKLLAEKLAIPFFDADDFHSIENKNKMSAGIPLTDDDRFDWLEKLKFKAKELINNGQSGIIACSALKQKYRNHISSGQENKFRWCFLQGTFDKIHARLQARKPHFMSPNLLQSQFDTLEIPKNSFNIDADLKPENIVDLIIKNINLKPLGLLGLGVMGKSLARNFASKGINLSLYNRFVAGSEENVANNIISSHVELQKCLGFEDLNEFVNSLQQPRKVFLMVNAGKTIDIIIDQLLPFLSPNDTIIDGGNSYFLDTKKRIDYLKTKAINFIGTGVSGGEKGALEGPSIMPSGDADAYVLVEEFLNKIAARDKNNQACCTYVGADGSGHFVKMVHNGIEYAEMQLIAELYAHFRYIHNLNPDEISEIFEKWNQRHLKSYLLEITVKILRKKTENGWLIDEILDKSGNKGTGNWATITASEIGFPSTIITSALFARYISTIKSGFDIKLNPTEKNQEIFDLKNIENAYAAARILNHQQGFDFIKTASEKYDWHINLSEIARIWTNGCIIRSALMEKLVEVFKTKNDLFEDAEIKAQLLNLQPNLKNFCISNISHNLQCSSHFAALDYLNTIGTDFKTANIIQAQRDFFGAHTYQRVNDESKKFYHTIWEDIQ